MTDFRVSWKGIEKIEAMQKRLGRAFTEREQSQAIRYSLVSMRKEMRDNIDKQRTGNLWYATDITIKKAGVTNTGGGVAITVDGIVGPRRARYKWNQQGHHAYVYELGSKPHTIRSRYGTPMPVYRKGKLLGVFDAITHSGSKGRYPFSRAIKSRTPEVSRRLVQKFGMILRKNIK